MTRLNERRSVEVGAYVVNTYETDDSNTYGVETDVTPAISEYLAMEGRDTLDDEELRLIISTHLGWVVSSVYGRDDYNYDECEWQALDTNRYLVTI